jgi:hypothetical protein
MRTDPAQPVHHIKVQTGPCEGQADPGHTPVMEMAASLQLSVAVGVTCFLGLQACGPMKVGALQEMTGACLSDTVTVVWQLPLAP